MMAEARPDKPLGFVPFTQYLRPDGTPRPGGFVRAPEIGELAQRFLAAGGSFAAEVLPGGSVALTADFEVELGERDDIAILLTANGPEIGGTVDRLVQRAVEWLDKRAVDIKAG